MAVEKNVVGKRENAVNQHFLFFPQCFLTYQLQADMGQNKLLKFNFLYVQEAFYLRI